MFQFAGHFQAKQDHSVFFSGMGYALLFSASHGHLGYLYIINIHEWIILIEQGTNILLFPYL